LKWRRSMEAKKNKVRRGCQIPHGTFNEPHSPPKSVYYYFGIKDDKDWPELPDIDWRTEAPSPEEFMEQKDFVRVTCDVLKSLPPPWAYVVYCTYGVCGYEKQSSAEIGQYLGVSDLDVRRLRAIAVRSMGSPSRLHMIQPLFSNPIHLLGRSKRSSNANGN